MASPTWAQAWAQMRASKNILEQTMAFGRRNATNFIGLEDTHTQALLADVAQASAAATSVGSARGNINAILRSSSTILTPHLQTLGKVINSPKTSTAGIIDDLYDYMIAQAPDETLNARDFVRGAVVLGGANAGNGSAYRVLVDDRNYPLDAGHGDVITMECIRDGNTGTDLGREVFESRGRSVGPDELEREGTGRGSGFRGELAARNADDSLLNNPTFETFGGTAAVPTSLASWTLGGGLAIGNLEINQVNFYRGAVREPTPGALRVKATGTLAQALTVRRTQLDPKQPYYLQVAWNREVHGATGTLILRYGARTATVVIAAQTGWQILRIAQTQDAWPDFATEQNLDIVLDWTRTAGDLLLDDVVFAPYISWDGHWIIPVGGSTPFLRGDTISFTDTVSDTEGTMQRWFWRAFQRHLPSVAGGTETIVD